MCDKLRLNTTSGFGLAARQTRNGLSQWDKHSSAPHKALQFFNILSAGRLVPGGRYVPQKTASQYYFRFRLGSAPNQTRSKSMGILMQKTIT